MTKRQSIAEWIRDEAYDDDGYTRPSDSFLRASGGVLSASSNWDSDGNTVTSGYSYSPTDTWKFRDGSKLIVSYSSADVEG